ncbi:hypothetical protein D9M68_729990 [compost metagenome]
MHELHAHGVELVARVGRQRPQRKAQERLDVQRARLVVVVELVVLLPVNFLVDDAQADQEAAPFVVAVGRDQGVVEVKECQIHGARFYLKAGWGKGAGGAGAVA